MFKFGIVGDIHIDTKVSSRRDNYFETCLSKIEEVSNNCKNVIILGDVFNRPSLSFEYFSLLYSHLSYLKSKNGSKFWAIIGNHDVYNELEESINKTALGLCFNVGLINLISVEGTNIDGYNFYSSYVNLDKCKEHLSTLQLNNNDILLLHQYFEDSFPGVTWQDIKNIGCKNIFVGHEHTPFEKFFKTLDDIKVYRCGSLLRNAATSSNLTRGIYYFVFDNLDDIKIASLESAKSACDVFTEKAVTQENLENKRFTKSIQEVISKYDVNVSNHVKFSLKTILSELNAPIECFQYLESKYNLIGEVLN